MPLDLVIQMLLAERQKIDAALAALGSGGPKRRGRPPKNPLANAPGWVTGLPESPAKPARKTRKFSAKQRAEQAKRMKAYWAAKKKAAKK